MEDIIISFDNISLNLDTTLLRKMHRVATTDYQSSESGGVLMGYKLLGKTEYRITDFTSPFFHDIIGWDFFHRIDKHHVLQIQESREKDKSIMYLGDWHSHPVNSPSPSKTDLSSWERMAIQSFTIADTLFYFLVIPNGISIYFYSRKGKQLHLRHINSELF